MRCCSENVNDEVILPASTAITLSIKKETSFVCFDSALFTPKNVIFNDVSPSSMYTCVYIFVKMTVCAINFTFINFMVFIS